MLNGIAITGIGIWCSLGRGFHEVLNALMEAKHGVGSIDRARLSFAPELFRTSRVAGIANEDYAKFASADNTVVTSFARESVADAVYDAGVEITQVDPTRVSLLLGTTVGGLLAFSSHFKARRGLPGDRRAVLGPTTHAAIAGDLATSFGFSGPTLAISTACSAGANAIGRACDLLQSGRIDYAIAGGVDVYTEVSLSGFGCLHALARHECRPFDDERDGLILGDASTFLVLERADQALRRGARVYAYILSYSIANEAHHATGPDPTGEGALHVMQDALNRARINARELNYVNAHGTGTRANDAMEAESLRRLLKDRISDVAVSSTKGAHGHALGGAGSLEAAVTAMSISYGFVPATLNTSGSTAEFRDMRVVREEAVAESIGLALSNSFGFGGNVAALLLSATPRNE